MGARAMPSGARAARPRLGGARPRPARDRAHAREPRARVAHADRVEGASRLRIAALGAGRMGRGIGQVFAYAGFSVDIIDFKARSPAEHDRIADAARAEIAANLALLRELGEVPDVERILRRVHIVSHESAPSALAAADMLFEGVTETEEAKRDAFTRACRHLRPEAIIASTTSSILADKLAAMVTRPERFLNAHFLNPAYLIPLVEVSPAKATSEATFAAVKQLLEGAGKVVVRCAASPGFI